MSAASGPESSTSGGTDVRGNEGSSKQGVRGATAGCREASDGSYAAEADGGVDGSSVAGTGGGEGDEGSSPGSDEVITATSVAGGEIWSKEADTYEFVERAPRIDGAADCINDKMGGNHQVKSCNKW